MSSKAAGNSNYTQGYSRAAVSSHARRTVESDAAFVLPHIKLTDKILDVGCGPGTITFGFGRLVPHGEVVGIDISEDVIHQAREAAAGGSGPDSQPQNVTFRLGDVLRGLDWISDDTFDVVFASQLFPHLPSSAMREAAMAEMRRVLKPGGVLATRTAAELHWYPRSCHLDRLWNARMNRGFGADDFAGPEMPALYKAAGFTKVVAGAGTTVYSMAGEREWWANVFSGRLADGEETRKAWKATGVMDAEIQETRYALKSWAEMDSAWYIGVQADILGWK